MENSPLTTEPPQLAPQMPPAGEKAAFGGMKMLIILFGLLILGGSVGAYILTYGGKGISVKSNPAPTSAVSQKAPSNSIVYGYWQDTSSYINSFDLTTNKNTLLAKLPSNVKHVKVISPTKIMYINNTDDRDYGSEIVVRTLTDQKEVVVLKADAGYGIDDYVVSADGNYLAAWQVAPPPSSTQLRGGGSRVITVLVGDSTKKYTIYDEPTTSPVRYPVAVLNNGDVFYDKFLANADAGWAYGMSYSNFTGTIKGDIESMAAGTYGSQPIQSPDGAKLVFAGYDGSKGPGTEVVNGFRRAIVSPNTVETFDLATKARSVIATSSEGVYTTATWDLQTNSPTYTFLSKNTEESGAFIYNTARSQSTKLKHDGVQSMLAGGAFLTSDQAEGDAAVGNLGSKYTPSSSNLYVVKAGDDAGQRIEVQGSFLQLIGITKSAYFSSTINANAASGKSSNKQLKLQTLGFKPALVPQRVEQQSGEKCRDVAAAQCNALHGTTFTGDQARTGTGNAEYDACFKEHFATVRGKNASNNCVDSPLYLYGQEGTNVKVSAGTILYSPNVPYSQEGFNIILQKEGKFSANGKSIESLSFDYKPAIKTNRPSGGVVVPRSDIERTVRLFSEKLGLNEQETFDTALYAKDSVDSPFVFISIYDDKTSKNILPLYFEPIPDSYRNIVFYLERRYEKDYSTYQLPIFEKVRRDGFTAVEISFIVR
jgi:hypothetical protein